MSYLRKTETQYLVYGYTDDGWVVESTSTDRRGMIEDLRAFREAESDREFRWQRKNVRRKPYGDRVLLTSLPMVGSVWKSELRKVKKDWRVLISGTTPTFLYEQKLRSILDASGWAYVTSTYCGDSTNAWRYSTSLDGLDLKESLGFAISPWIPDTGLDYLEEFINSNATSESKLS